MDLEKIKNFLGECYEQGLSKQDIFLVQSFIKEQQQEIERLKAVISSQNAHLNHVELMKLLGNTR